MTATANPKRATASQLPPRVAGSTRLDLGASTALVVAAAALVALCIYAYTAVQWSTRPFMGVFLTRTLVINGAQPTETGTWSGLNAGLRRGDRIVAINQESLSPDLSDYSTAYASFLRVTAEAFKPNRSINLEVLRPAFNGTVAEGRGTSCGEVIDNSARCRVTLPLREFPGSDFVAWFLVSFASAAVVWGTGVSILRLRTSNRLAQLVSILCSTMAVFMAGLFDLDTSHLLIPVWIVSTTAMGVCLIMLALYFPIRSTMLYPRPYLRFIPIVIGAIFAVVAITVYYTPPYPLASIDMTNSTGIFALVGLMALMVGMLVRRSRSSSALVRDQATTTLIGILLAVTPISIWLINLISRPLFGSEALPFNLNASTPFFILIPLSLGYAVFQTRLQNTDRVASQMITYAIMLLALIIGYFLLVFGATLMVGDVVRPTETPIIAIVIFFMALLFLPMRSRLQQFIDEIYFRTRRNYQAQAEAFAQRLTTLVTFDDILGAYRAELDNALAPSSVFIFLPNPETGEYTAYGKPHPETDVRFSARSSLLDLLAKSDDLVYLEPGRPWANELLVERARLTLLKTLVIVSLRGGTQINGFVCIGAPRSSTGVYGYEALRFVQNITRQISVAVERAQVVNSLQRRVRELDVLSQVSQAVNFTFDFDDLLELIVTQSGKLIESRHFYIVMRDSRDDELYYAFFLEDDERYEDKEDVRWAIGRDLYSDIVRSGVAERTTDYARTMNERGLSIMLESPNLKAWMGVPLIAGTRTLGVLATATTQPNRAYSDEQLKIFSDLGALAATSLDKARLFAETNSRARQLAVLNDISRQLVAFESDLAQLLELITKSAVDILDAEAGSLLLTTDDSSGDLEFRVVTGGSGTDLVGVRIKKGRGLVGEVAAKGEMIIVADAPNDPRWSGELSQGKFRTQSVVAVPLRTQNRVIGVLELLNKKSGDRFDKDDADLLTTFAGQAAVAIENARLFQMTDFQLSERVAELETMERIDLELNRALDLGDVADITVRYAMEHSSASAGLLAVVAPDSPYIEVVAIHGYELEDYPEGAEGRYWMAEKGIIGRVLRTKRAEVITDVTFDPGYVPSLRAASSQIIVPMMSAGTIIALLLLETKGEHRFGLANMPFVQRLAEHASIAIANAQLYAELTRANNSKSEFVSFVAHELKNPLTSIKGFADILLRGAVGELSDQQRNFLGTIRSNADRMNTLVSDLNDVTKLQTNNMRIEFAPINFRNVVTETLRPLQKQIEDKEQELVIDMADSLPDIYADQNRLIQVLTNLVSNAHKYSPPQGRITIAARVIHQSADKGRTPSIPMLEISVRDTGIGMSEEDLARLFTPYFRSENPLAREQPGTGLGLTITRGIIQRHGGDIWVESELGVGTAFFFSVPVSIEGQGEVSPAQAQP